MGATYPLAMLRENSLARVEQWYGAGLVSRCDLDAYLAEWNATPGRFSRAVYRDGAVRMYDAETGNNRWIKLASNLSRRGDNASAPVLRAALGEPETCYLCGLDVTWATAELDHIIPRTKGGTNAVENLAWAHRPRLPSE